MPAQLVNGHTSAPGQPLPSVSSLLKALARCVTRHCQAHFPLCSSHCLLRHMWSIDATEMLKSVTLFQALAAKPHSNSVSLLRPHRVKLDPPFPLSGYTGAGGLREVMRFPERQMSESSALQEMNRFLPQFGHALLRQRVQSGHKDGLRFLLVTDRYKHVALASENWCGHILRTKGAAQGTRGAHEVFSICVPSQLPSFAAQILQV